MRNRYLVIVEIGGQSETLTVRGFDKSAAMKNAERLYGDDARATYAEFVDGPGVRDNRHAEDRDPLYLPAGRR